MTRILRLVLLCVAGLTLTAGAALADNGNAPTTMSFFSGGGGARADWFVSDDQPPGDTDRQAIRIQTTFDGYAGILFHHVEGIPAAAFPDSSFWVRTPFPYTFEPATLGTPRIVVAFETLTGQPSGDASLTQNVRGNSWEHVSDTDQYPNSGWDVRSASCPNAYHVTWPVAQACHGGELVRAAYLTTDPYNIYHLIDDIEINGKRFSSASDNGNGLNDPAGPDATTDPSLLPPFDLLP